MTPVMLQKQNLAKPARCSIVDWQVPTRDLDYTLWNPRLCIMFKECPLECSIINPLPPTQLVGTKKWLIERYEIVCDVTAHVTQRSCLKQWILKNGKAGPKQLVLSIWNHRGHKFPLPPVIIRHYFVRDVVETICEWRYCLMPLVREVSSSVHLSGSMFTHHGLNISLLPNPLKQLLKGVLKNLAKSTRKTSVPESLF